MNKIKLVLFLILSYLVVCPKLVAQVATLTIKDHQKKWNPAPARILEIWQTAEYINYQPVVKIKLQVKPPGADSFIVNIHHIYSVLEAPYLNVGKIAQVRYDSKGMPFDPSKKTKDVVIEAYGEIGQDSAVMNQNTKDLLAYNTLHGQILSYGDSATAIVLEYSSWRNVEFTLDTMQLVVANLDVKVMPNGKPPFRALIEAVIIKKASVYKCQPGKIISVKYDPNDLTKVTIIPHH